METYFVNGIKQKRVLLVTFGTENMNDLIDDHQIILATNNQEVRGILVYTSMDTKVEIKSINTNGKNNSRLVVIKMIKCLYRRYGQEGQIHLSPNIKHYRAIMNLLKKIEF